MKKWIIVIFTFALLCSVAQAETYLSATSEPTREYTYDDYDNLILQDGDLAPENVCQTIWAAIEGAVGEGDVIQEVSLNDGELTIKVNLDESNAAPLTVGMLAQTRASSITDSLLSLTELDDLWVSVHLVFPSNEAVFSQNMAQGEGEGRYIDLLDIMEQIPD